MIVTTNGPQNIGQIQRHFIHGNLFLSPEEYQRENAWNLYQKRLLIDTIFQGMDIPKLYFWKIDHQTLHNGYPDGDTKNIYSDILERKRKDNDDPDPYLFEAVDGQQRIRTILEYMGVNPPNEKVYRGIWGSPFPAMDETPMAKGRTFDKLNAEQQIKFEEKPLTVMVLEKATINEVRDMFLRLQNGTPLNAQQKRDAMGSYIGRVAREISMMPFFKESVPFDNSGAAHHLVASQMLLLELKDKIVSCTSRQLDKIYEHYKKVSVDPVIVAKAKKIVGILGNIFSAKNHHLNRSYVLGFYWAISRILNIYTINNSEYQQIKENFEKLDDSRLVAMNRDYSNKTDDEIYFNLSLSMSRGTDGADGINTRHAILSQFLFDNVNLLAHPSLDPKRNFTHEEKLILYRRAQGCCQLEHNGKVCGRLIDFDDAVVDHIIPHSKNGLTVLENGRISYKSCNISRGNRDDFNPEVNCHLIEQNEPDEVAE